jgi:hypothetical protein
MKKYGNSLKPLSAGVCERHGVSRAGSARRSDSRVQMRTTVALQPRIKHL